MCINCLNAQKVDVRLELTKKTSHCKSRDFLRKRRLKIRPALKVSFVICEKTKSTYEQSLKTGF